MLVSLVLAVELVISLLVLPPALPSAEPTASPEPLREIGHVYSSGMCTAIASRANRAISSALRNDKIVADAVTTLRAVNLDSDNGLEKRAGMKSIERLADDLRVTSQKADKEIKQLRTLSEHSVDPVRKDELKAFADSLGGALRRQDRIGSDLQTMLLRMHGRDNEQEAYKQIQVSTHVVMPDQIMDALFAPLPYNVVARQFARDLETRTVAIAGDESKAAEHVVGAVNGC